MDWYFDNFRIIIGGAILANLCYRTPVVFGLADLPDPQGWYAAGVGLLVGTWVALRKSKRDRQNG